MIIYHHINCHENQEVEKIHCLVDEWVDVESVIWFAFSNQKMFDLFFFVILMGFFHMHAATLAVPQLRDFDSYTLCHEHAYHWNIMSNRALC